MSVLYFLLLVGVLVVIHELGHYAAAKLLDVKVLRFSIGYGRPLFRFRGRETEYQVGVFPLGGYVRILGVEGEGGDDPRDARRSFASRPLWQRLVIVFAGPAANLILPVIIYFVFFAGHSELPAAVVGDIIDDGPAQRAGIEPGDTVLAIDGDAVRYWEDLEHRVQQSAGKELHLRLERNGKTFERYVVPVEEIVRKRDGGSASEGRIGITRAPFVPLIGVLDAGSPAAKAGLRTGDLVISIDGNRVTNWSDVMRRLGHSSARTNIVYFRGAEVPGIPQVRLLDARFADLVPETRVDETLKRTIYTGIEKAEMFVAHVDPGSPADLAGLKPGDLIVALDDQPVSHWMALDQKLQSDAGRAWELTWKRTNLRGEVETIKAKVTQIKRTQPDEYGHTVHRLVFGARNDVERGQPRMVPIDGRFSYALSKAVDRTGETIGIMVKGFLQVIRGDAPSEDLGGPLMMYRVASVSGNRGWESFLLLMALISVNLALINLLPVPMLDGGHVLVFAIEAIRRRPLTQRSRERVQLAGLAVVVLITLLALRNDVLRLLR
ncbi:MAG TPA: RIP metalloprotease RseP [Kofleriaceae bacterium]|nr:RIP metalloprotease RseP [Kofleriaceae bacterium]